METNSMTIELMDVVMLDEFQTTQPQCTSDKREHDYIADLRRLTAKVPGGLTADYTNFRIILKLFGPSEKTLKNAITLNIKYIAFFKNEEDARLYYSGKDNSCKFFDAQELFYDERVRTTPDLNKSLETYNGEEYLKLVANPGTYSNEGLRLLIYGHQYDFNFVSEYPYIKIVYFADYTKSMTLTLNTFASPTVPPVETWFPIKQAPGRKQKFTSLSFCLLCRDSLLKQKKRSLPVKTGDITLIPQDAEYQHYVGEDKRIVFNFNVLNGVSDEIRVFNITDKEKYRELFVRAYDMWHEKAAGYRYTVTAVLYEILGNLQHDGALMMSSIDEDVSCALDIIEKNFQRSDFKIEDLSKEVFLSEVHLRQKFRKQLGISPKRYLIRRRIQEAEIMLKTKYYSQLEISQKCGFSDVKYFRFAFREETGKTITEYKRSI